MNQSFSNAESTAISRLEAGIQYGTVIPVVGAGISRQSADLPSWNTLLSKALDWTEQHQDELQLNGENQKILATLNRDSPTMACYQSWVEAVFGNSDGRHWDEPAYREWLHEVFGAFSVTDRSVYQALKEMDPRVVVTTNYDKLLSNELIEDGDVVTWKHGDTIRALLRERRGILHLHGTFDDPESVILTPADYERIAGREERSRVAQLLTSHAILLFVGVSAEGATDRHLSRLLKLGMADPEIGAPQAAPTHVLLHRGEIEPRAAARLDSLDIQPVRFGDSYSDLAPFLRWLSRRRTGYRTAVDLVGLDDTTLGEALDESRWAPEKCLGRVESSLSFMGLRSSKWVGEEGTAVTMDRVLDVLDSRGRECVRFLILNPCCDAYGRLETMRGMKLSSDHLERLAEMEQRHESLIVKCVDFISAFRFTAVNNAEVGLALYPTDPIEFDESRHGWMATHHSLHTRRRWSLARSLLFMFDEHFKAAKSLRDVAPEFFS
jgi:hypothetical protein